MLSVIPSGASQRTGRPPQWAGLLLAKPAEFMPWEGWRIEPAGILPPAYVDRPQSPGGRQVVEAFGRQVLAGVESSMPWEGWRIETAGILAPAYVDRHQSPGGRQVVETFGRQVLAGVESSQRTAVLGVGRSGANVSRTARIHENERKNRCLA